MRALIVTLALLLGGEIAAAQEHAVREIRDVPYAAGPGYEGDRGLLDLYLPEGAEGFPVLISIHGGGLIQGDKSQEVHIGRRFAGAGVGTAVINYRLSPGVSHPAHIQDVARAVAWVRANIGEHGGDPDALFVVGHSAGGYLAGLIATDARYLEAEGLSLRSLRGAIPVSGFFYVDEVAPDRPEHVWGTDRSTWLEASPHSHLRADAPPILLLYADGDADWRREQHERFARDLKAAGHGQVDVEEFPDRSHSGIWEGMADVEDVSETILDFIRGRMAG
jgi:acetyl esterase/lipase